MAGFLYTGPKLSLESKSIIFLSDFLDKKKRRSFFCLTTTICKLGNENSFISPKPLPFFLFFFTAKLFNVNISSNKTKLYAFTTQDVLELLVNSFNAATDGICS